MKTILMCLCLLTSTFAFSQKSGKIKIKVDRKKDMVIVNNEPFFKYINKGNQAIELFNLKDESFVYIDMTCYIDPNAVSDSNPRGNVCYRTMIFEGIEEKTEITGVTIKGLAKLFIDHNIYKDNTLNIDDTKKFIERNGRKHSAEQLNRVR